MNDLDLLRAFGDELEAPHDVRETHLRHRVMAEIARRPSPTGRTGARVVWGLTAAATVVAVTLVATGVTHENHGAASTTASPGLNGSQVLLLAAEHASSASSATGSYWLTATEFHRLRLASSHGTTFKLDDGLRSESWTARSDSDTSRRLEQELGLTPAGSADRTAWKQAGSPPQVDLHDLGQDLKDYLKPDVPVAAQPAEVFQSPARNAVHGIRAEKAAASNSFVIGRQRLTLAQLGHLPTDPAALRKVMLNGYKNNAGFGTPDSWVFSSAVDVLTLPVTPQVRASVYRILAGLPSVRNLGPAKDIKGRTGNAVAIDWNGPEGTEEHRLIIDAKSGNLLAEETRLVKPIGKLSWLKPTDIERTTVVTRSGWTNATPPAKTN
jgi:hypothetical protein